MTIPTWRLPMSAPPRVLHMGASTHYPLAALDEFRLPGLWCIHFYRYSGELRIDGARFAIEPGHASITPPGALLEFAYGNTPSVHIFAHFALDGTERGETIGLPAMSDLDADFEPMWREFEAAVGWSAMQPRRATARLWDVLWRLEEIEARRSQGHETTGATASIHPRVADALRIIEARLGAPLQVGELAGQVGLSHNHFLRLFQAATGTAPSTYIRRRRIERALHLLRHSTLPMKAIAAHCQLGDLQSFNKVMRRELGAPPRALRVGIAHD